MHKTFLLQLLLISLNDAVFGQDIPGSILSQSSPQGPGFSLPSQKMLDSDRVEGPKMELQTQTVASTSPEPLMMGIPTTTPETHVHDDMPALSSARVTGEKKFETEKKLESDIQQKLDEDEELAKLLRPDNVQEEDVAHNDPLYKSNIHANDDLDLDNLLQTDKVKEHTWEEEKHQPEKLERNSINDVLGSERVQGEKKDEKDAFDELEASQVKEAALDDKLGIELKSIVQQIQDMQREVAEALKEGED